MVQTSEDVDATTQLIHHFSSWTRLRRAVVCVIRLENLLWCLSQEGNDPTQPPPSLTHGRSSEQEKGVCKDLALRGLLTVDELMEAEREIIRFCQRSRFPVLPYSIFHHSEGWWKIEYGSFT